MKELENIYKTQTIPIVKFRDDKYVLNSKYKIGKIKLNNKIAMLELKQNSNTKIFIEFDSLNGAYNDDKVVVQILFNPKGKTKAKVVHILESSNSTILVFCQDKKLFTIKESVQIITESLELNNGDVGIVQNGKVLEYLGNIKDSKVDEKISLYLYNEVYRLNQFENVKIPTWGDTITKNRIDLTHLDFCTIDPASAKDHDDAIYFDELNSELYVAIADVSAYVKENSKLDQEAQKRAFSIYLPHKVLPMLPFELSTDLCSLVPNKPRLSYVFKIKLDIKNIKVKSAELFEATIESKNKYSYEYIDEVIKQNDSTNEFVKLYNITKKFRNKRLKNGYDFRNDEVKLILDKEEDLKDFQVESSTPSHSLVEECMLLANQEAAKRLKLLGIYRVHDEPSAAKIKKLLDEVNELGLKAKLKKDVHSTILSIQSKAQAANIAQEVDELIIQSQQQAKYSSIKQEHFGLGFKDYSHFTSPIRRYADLVLHRILKTHNIPKDIENICEDISSKEREIASLVWDYEDRKYSRYLNKNINKVFTARVVDTTNKIVKLDDLSMKGARVYLENYSGEKLFSELKIEIISSDIISKKVIAKVVK
ncbi:MAG: ribonuclease R family protein [Campylobacterota bacterium]|nr:ribonuclease R family protein [Campylobacterota bacterium]